MAAKKTSKTGYSSESVMKKRLRKFRSIKRGYYSFIIIVSLYIISFFCPLLMNYKAWVVKYDGKLYFPIAKYRTTEFFHQDIHGEMLFKIDYMKQPGMFLAKLHTGSDPVSEYLNTQLSPTTKDLANHYLSSLSVQDELLEVLRNDLDKISQKKIDFENKDFSSEDYRAVIDDLQNKINNNPLPADLFTFTIKLLSGEEPVYKYLKREFAYDTRNKLSEFINAEPLSPELQSSLVADVRRILKGELIYNEERFAGIKLVSGTYTLLEKAKKVEGKDLIRLNRLVLGDAFRKEIELERIYGEANYRLLKQQLKEENAGNWALMPLYPYGPYESLLVPNTEPPNPPSREHWFGTDDRGRDVFVRLAYGFNVSISFSLCVLFISYLIGVSIGASLGYFGGRYDIIMQRFIEIWSALPFLYTVMIISSLVQPTFFLLVFIMMFVSWMGMTYFIRGEFYREKAKDYVHAAIAMGASDFTIVFKHILPNALTPVITFAPFAVVSGIGTLVGLDYLGFGLPPPTASWGEMIRQGMANIFSWWMVLFTFSLLFMTLLLVVFVGEAIREAFDPRTFSRLR
ncbi:ABC transporter permease subunit [bacterium]|nr:ABC transporter permease subunit [bacterium]